MILSRQAGVVAAIAAASMAAVVGCSDAGGPSSSVSATTVKPIPATSQPAPTSRPKAQRVDVAVAPEGNTTVRLGGPPMRFRVTLVNGGPDVPRVGLVVSLGHCSCGVPGPSMMATGSMRMLDPRHDAWVRVPYVREGTGMDYITQNLVPPFPLTHGQTVTYEFQLQLDADQDGITDGETAIDATLTDPDNPIEGDRFGDGSYHPITVEA